MIYELLPADWDRICCHPSRWRFVCRLLTGQHKEEYIKVEGRDVRIIIDVLVPMNAILIGNSKRAIMFYGLSETIESVKENLRGKK